MSKEDIQNMLNNVADANFESAEQSFNAAISNKVSAALENIRVKVASEMVQKESVEQIDEISGELLGRYIQKARKDISDRREHDKKLDSLPQVKKYKDKIMDYHNRKEYNSRGESIHQAKIDRAREKVELAKKKEDPNYPKSVISGRRYNGIANALGKLQHGKLTNEETS